MNVTCDVGEEKWDVAVSGLILVDDDDDDMEGESGEIDIELCPPDSLPVPPAPTKEGCCMTKPG